MLMFCHCQFLDSVIPTFRDATDTSFPSGVSHFSHKHKAPPFISQWLPLIGYSMFIVLLEIVSNAVCWYTVHSQSQLTIVIQTYTVTGCPHA